MRRGKGGEGERGRRWHTIRSNADSSPKRPAASRCARMVIRSGRSCSLPNLVIVPFSKWAKCVAHSPIPSKMCVAYLLYLHMFNKQINQNEFQKRAGEKRAGKDIHDSDTSRLAFTFQIIQKVTTNQDI